MKKTTCLLNIILLLLSLSPEPLARLWAEEPARPLIAAPDFHPVELNIDEEAFDGVSRREKLDQLRDWLLFTALTDSALTVEELNQTCYDLPASRKGYLQAVANFEYGDMRSRYIGDGRVVALVPECSAAQLNDKLAHIADEHRKNTGAMPQTLIVSTYRIDLRAMSAMLSRPQTVAAAQLFSDAYGYYETEVASLEDLQQFMRRVDDLTFADRQGNVLKLGGRKIKGHDYRGIRPEDVAAIWQSEKHIQEQEEGVLAAYTQRAKAFDSNWRQRFAAAYSTRAEQQQLKREYEQAQAAFLKEVYAEQRRLNLVAESGFSLDPSFDFEAMSRYFDDEVVPQLREMNPGKANLLTAQDVARVKQGLAEKNTDPFYTVLSKVSKTLGRDKLRAISDDIGARFGFQKARYDGDLQGTEVGMVLFYTDLMAKLWGFDFADSAPRHINGFKSEPARPISPIYLKEISQIPNTRFWFGPQNKGFKVEQGGDDLLFARRATRLFSASSDDFKPGVEVEANYLSQVFINWWDDHYEEVAEFEPEYERLNEIMKWSVLVGWLNDAQQGDRLSFLKGVRVNRDNWFPDWAVRHTELRFKEWDKVGFHPRNYKGVTTEAMPLLESRAFSVTGDETDAHSMKFLSGGVSLAGKQLLKGRAALSEATRTSPLLSRANVKGLEIKQGMKSLTTLEENAYTFRPATATGASVMAIPKNQARLRARFSEIAPDTRFVRTVSKTPEGVRLQVDMASASKAPALAPRPRPGAAPLPRPAAASAEVGSLKVAREGNAYKLSWESRTVERGHSLARRLSRSADPEALLATHGDVDVAYKVGADSYLIKLHRADKWLKMSASDELTVDIAKGFQSRVADISSGARNVNIAWVEPAAAQAEITRVGFVRLRGVHTGVIAEAGRPPTGLLPLEVRNGATVVRGQFDPKTGSAYFNTLSMGRDPARAGRLLNASDLGEIKRLADGGADRLIYVVKESPKVGGVPVEELARVDSYLGTEQFGKAINDIQQIIKTYGATPELKLRQALARIGQRRFDEAAVEFNRALSGVGDRHAFLAEVNERLAASSGMPRSQRMQFAARGDGFALEYDYGHYGGDFKFVDLVEPHNLPDGKARFYVQDSPAFGNLDFNAGLTDVMQQAVSGKLGVVVKLRRGAITQYHPTRIYSSEAPNVYKAIGESRAGQAARGDGFRVPTRYRISGGVLTVCPDEDDCDDDDEEDVYILIVPKQ